MTNDLNSHYQLSILVNQNCSLSNNKLCTAHKTTGNLIKQFINQPKHKIKISGYNFIC